MRQGERDMNEFMDAVERKLDIWENSQWEALGVRQAEKQFNSFPDLEASQDKWDAFYRGEEVNAQIIELPKIYLDGFGILTDQDDAKNPRLAI